MLLFSLQTKYSRPGVTKPSGCLVDLLLKLTIQEGCCDVHLVELQTVLYRHCSEGANRFQPHHGAEGLVIVGAKFS